MLRPNLEAIPAAAFPAGYGIRPMGLEDIALWTEIQREAEPYLTITDNLFQEQFGADGKEIRQRCFIITNPNGAGIGTISAWFNADFRGVGNGRIHWVAVRPSCQGLGLGKAALSYALNQLAQWHDRCYLVTSAARLAAIRLYLNFGFVPDLTLPNARAVWGEIGNRLKHPALVLESERDSLS